MKAAGVTLVVLGALAAIIAPVATTVFGDGQVSPIRELGGLIMLVGGLIVWSLQQIREVLIGGHPRDVKAGVDEHGYKPVRSAKAERNS